MKKQLKKSKVDLMDIRLKKIDKSFKYGTFRYSAPIEWKIDLAILAVVSIGTMILGIANKNTIDNPKASFSVLILCSTFLLILILIFAIKSTKSRKDILLWLEDAVILEARGKTVETFRPYYFGLQIEFEFEGRKIIKKSTYRTFTFQHEKGGWKELANKKIVILYSPKYDEVMIPKNTNNN